MRKLTTILILILAVTVCFVLVSCGGENETSSDTVPSTSGTTADSTTDTPGDGTTADIPGDSTPDTPGDSTPADTDETTAPLTHAPEPERVKPEEVTLGKIRVQLLSDSLVRLEVAMSGGKFQDKPSYSVINREDWYKVEYTTEETDDATVIKTAKYHVVVPKDVSALTNVVITKPDGEQIWHYESRTDSNIFLPSPSDDLDSWYFCDNPRVIPSENGYSLPADGSEPSKNGWTTNRNVTDCFVFLPDGDYKTFQKDFIELTGRSEMITLNLLGYWDSRWYAYTESTAIQQIKDYQRKGYSIDVLVIDTDWRDASRGVGYEINDQLFPDMARFLERAHDLGVSIVFNDHPEPAAGTSSLVDPDEIKYRTENLTLILSLGLDYWWYDRNWSVALKPIDNDLSLYTTGMYAFQWITEQYYNSLVAENKLEEYARRPLIMANVDGIWNGDMTDPTEVAAHRYTLQWTGDIGTGADSLRKEIYNAIYGSSEMGIPYISADLGGHTSEVSSEMYVRWMQFGALSTICRVHCTRPFSRMPWLYGETAESVTKEYVGMRYRLLPLYYALSHENYETGLPILRRLDIEYPQYVEASRNDEYLLGDYILVAPIEGKTLSPLNPSTMKADGKEGFKVEYFKNDKLSGTPDYTGYTTVLSNDWGDGGPSEIGGQAENFSARWTGQFTPTEDVMLCFFADDGVKCWIDGKLVVDGWTIYDNYLNTPVLEAGKTYDVKVEYCEYGGKAHMLAGTMDQAGDKRTVFLPDGTWMDVWTGKEYTGPCTVTVYHDLETSPIFVRQGAVIPLVSQGQNTSEIDWSKITLDVYPSVDYDASTVIYEDDTKTVGYKDGQYRTTDVTMDYVDGALLLKIGATVGSFKNAPDFTERDYTIRLHTREGFGKIESVTVNGVAVEFKTIAKSADASPFLEKGAALDSDIVEFTVKTSLTKSVEVKINYASTKEDGRNNEYFDTPVSFKVAAKAVTKSAMQNLNLTEVGTRDWALFGATDVSDIVRKKNGAGLIGTIDSWDTAYGFQDNYSIKWSDGDTTASGSTTNGTVSDRNLDIILKTDGKKTTYTLYIGGYKSVAKISIRDRAGNVETLTVGNATTNFYRVITIECEAGEASELAINYSLLCGQNITLAAVAVS